MPPPGKAAADPNAAWAAYYSHYYQQPPGPVPGQPPAPAAPPVQGEPPQPPPTGQADYTKAWEEYYKKIGECTPKKGGGHPVGLLVGVEPPRDCAGLFVWGLNPPKVTLGSWPPLGPQTTPGTSDTLGEPLPELLLRDHEPPPKVTPGSLMPPHKS